MATPTLAAEITLKTGGFAAGIKSALTGVTNLGASLLRMPGLGPAVAGSLAALAGPAALAASAIKAIGEAADLGTLAKTLGDSVNNAYAIQKAFTAADGTAQGAVSAVTALQRALGGVNEQGEPTQEIFKQIGLNIDELKKQAPTEALLQTLDAMKGLDRASQAFASGKVFGKGAGTEALTVLRSGGDARAAFGAAQDTGAIFARTADGADRLLKTLDRIKILGASLAIPAIEGLIPLLQAAATGLERIGEPLKQASKAVGEWMVAVAQAFAEGDLGQFLWLSIQSAVVKSYEFAVRVFGAMRDAVAGIWEGLVDRIASAFAAVGAVIEVSFNDALQLIYEGVESLSGTLADLARKTGLDKLAAGLDSVTVGANRRANDARFDSGQAQQVLAETVKEIDLGSILAKALEGFADAPEGLGGAVKVLTDRFRLAAGAAGGPTGAGSGLPGEAKLDKQRRDAPSQIERIGGILAGGGFGVAADHGKQTANNTKVIAEQAKKQTKALDEAAEALKKLSFANVA